MLVHSVRDKTHVPIGVWKCSMTVIKHEWQINQSPLRICQNSNTFYLVHKCHSVHKTQGTTLFVYISTISLVQSMFFMMYNTLIHRAQCVSHYKINHFAQFELQNT